MAQSMRQTESVNTDQADGTLPAKTDFSLVLGGPLYQLYLRTRLAGPTLELVWRRVIGISLICWVPLFLLALIAGNAFGGVSIPFVFDLSVHVRFLAVVPLLVGAELFVHVRIGEIVLTFLAIDDGDMLEESGTPPGRRWRG